MDLPAKELGCHRTGFAQDCRELVTSGKCNRWIQIQGHDPNTGQPVNRCDCVDNWTPMLLVENSMVQRQTGAAVETLRNQMIKTQRVAIALDHGDTALLALESREETRFLSAAGGSLALNAPNKDGSHERHD